MEYNYTLSYFVPNKGLSNVLNCSFEQPLDQAIVSLEELVDRNEYPDAEGIFVSNIMISFMDENLHPVSITNGGWVETTDTTVAPKAVVLTSSQAYKLTSSQAHKHMGRYFSRLNK